MNTLPAVWQAAERQWPGKAAIMARGERVSYGDLAARIRRLCTALVSAWHVRPGEVVGLLAPNSVEFIVSYFAVTAIGAMVQPVDERLRPEEIQFVLDDSKARQVIIHRALWSRFGPIRNRLPALQHVLGIDVTGDGIERYEDWMNPISTAPYQVFAGPAEGDVAELMYTSGTTGRPKPVMRSHANVRAASGNAIRAFGFRPDDIIAIVMPLSHSSALVSQMLPLIMVGGGIVPVQRFDTAELLDVIRRERVSCLRAVPAMFRMLMASSNFDAVHLPSLRLLMNSSAAIDPETFLEVKDRFPDVEVVNSYGLTEASTSSILSDKMARTHPNSIGVPIEGVEMRIVASDGRDAADDEEGEIWVRGPHVFRGYRQMPAETQAALAGDWLRTGDLGRRDKEGLFYFLGRRDDVINCGGRKYAPLEVENCILELPEIAEVAVIGIPHRVLGQVAKAFVVYRPGVTADPKAVSRHCARHLSSHKVPFEVQVLTSLPRNSIGKVLYRQLQAASDSAI